MCKGIIEGMITDLEGEQVKQERAGAEKKQRKNVASVGY